MFTRSEHQALDEIFPVGERDPVTEFVIENGPLFQAIQRMTARTENGANATLQVVDETVELRGGISQKQVLLGIAEEIGLRWASEVKEGMSRQDLVLWTPDHSSRLVVIVQDEPLGSRYGRQMVR